MPAGRERMYAIATRPLAGSIPIAGRTAFRPRVTAIGAAPLRAVRRGRDEDGVRSDARRFAVVPRRPEATRPVDLCRRERERAEVGDRAASVDGGDANRRTPSVAPPSVERDDAIAKPSDLPEVHDDEVAVRPDGREDPDPGARADVDRERPRETRRRPTSCTASMSRSAECV